MTRTGRRSVALALLLTTTALAGCIGSGDAPLESSNATDAGAGEAAPNASVPSFPNGTQAPERLQVRDCYEHFGILPVQSSAYSERLPEGFSMGSYFGEPSGHTAELGVFGQACDRPDGTTVSRAGALLYVDPPDAWEKQDARHGLVLSWVTTSEHLARVNEAWGFGTVAQTGDVSLEETQTPAARQGILEVSAGETTLRLETLAGGPPGEGDGGQLRLFALGEDGTVAGAKDLNWTSSQSVVGSGVASGSTDAGFPEGVPADTGFAGHFWGFDETETYVDLPPREGS